MSHSLVLLYFPLSTASQKVRLCQLHKGISMQEQIVDLVKLEQLSPDYLAHNPNGYVPTLLVDGQAIYESSIINEFLDEISGAPRLLPSDPIQRAHVRMWNKYLDTGPTVQIASPTYRDWVAPALASAPKELLAQKLATAPDATTRARWLRTLQGTISDAEVAAAYEAMAVMLHRMESLLASRPWLFGDELTLADLETLPLVVRLVHLGRASLFAQLPNVQSWLQRAQSLPAYQAVYGSLQPLGQSNKPSDGKSGSIQSLDRSTAHAVAS